MHILHISFEKETAQLWAEKQFDEPLAPQKRRGRRPKNPPPKAHPFAADKEELTNILPDLINRNNFVKSLVWLPTLNETPLPSSPILGQIEPGSDNPKLSPWALWSYSMEKEEVISLLRMTQDKEQLNPKLHLGKEFAFLHKFFLFLLSLTVRQRYLPSLNNKESVWIPLFMGEDKNRLHTFEKNLPSVCRALTTSVKQLEPPQSSPKSLLMTLAETTIDALVRKGTQEITVKKETVHDLWLNGLIRKKNSIKGSPSDFSTLTDSIKEWKKPIDSVISSPFKFCMRLEEPQKMAELKDGISTAESPWKITYLLQPYDDQSLFVQTADAWNPKGAKRRVLERPNFQPRQFVLSSLGVASAICPPVESSLEESIPSGFNLNSSESFHFLQEQAPALEEAGFGVICPKWWKKRASLVARGVVEQEFSTNRNRSIWEDLQTDWQIYLGENELSIEELHQLALLKEPIVNMRGEWVLLSKDQIQKAIEFLKNKPVKPENALDLLQISAGVPEDVHGIEVSGLEASGELAEFFSAIKNHDTLETLKAPTGFQGVLRPYQLRGFSWMSFLHKWRLGACLADDMGLGKTPQTLALVMRNWEETDNRKPTLLICPTSLTGNWSREAKKFVPKLPIYVHHGPNRLKEKKFGSQVKKSGLVITSYSLLHRDEALLSEIEWSGIILDEAQNIKNSSTKQTKAAHKLKSDYRIALTGTPVENNVGDLWSLMHFLNPGYLGTQESFRKNFFTPIQIERSSKATNQLQRLTTPLVLRRLKTDKTIITDLPEKQEMKVYCSLTPEQISLYETVVSDTNGLLKQKEGIDRKGTILATLLKLKQICNHPVNFLSDGSDLYKRSGKLSRLQEMLEETFAVGDKSLIFTQFSEMGTLLKNYIEEQTGREVLFLHGGVSKKNRDLMVERFQEDEGGPHVFILSLKAGGVGLNLTRANHVFHFDRWWNPAIENQATDRAFRIGQKKNVQVHKFISTGTIEERIDEMIEEKKSVANAVVGAGESWITELSTEDLKDLWKLRIMEGI